jgi:AraC family transcriptional regulator of adaptative response/methylated-DNA-[protein]-cysteine methyltransferase
MIINSYPSNLGQVSIATTDNLVCGIALGTTSNDLIARLRKFKIFHLPYELNEQPNIRIINIQQQALKVINDGDYSNLPQIFLTGTIFQKEVWNALRTIPKGITTTYQQVANTIGKPNSVRAVANAIGANPLPILIPCHRVIRSDGQLGGYHFGSKIKRQLLQREGINC